MLRLAILACLLASCGKGETQRAPAKQTVADACAQGEQKGPIRWFEDDWPGAVACAKQRKLPIVLDLWAPWCHTCIAMQTTVFLDPSFAAKSDQFVFAALDADRETNAAAVGKYATTAMPTFYIIGHDEQVLARFVGAATLQQFQDFIGSGARAAAGGMAAPDARLLGAERALAIKDFATADVELGAALSAAPMGWPRRVEAVASLQATKKKLGEHRQCVELTDKNMVYVGNTAIATNFWATAIECADEVLTKSTTGTPTEGKPTDAEAADLATRVRARALAALQAVVGDPRAPLSIDDRVEAFGYVRDALDRGGKKDEAQAAAEKARALLDDAYAKAPTPFARMTFIWPRADVYAYLKRPLDIVADYEKLAGELPHEYDPAARLGWLYMKGGKLTEAATWTDKALALVYGPRKARVLNQRAEIAVAAGDKALERKLRGDIVKLWESLPPGQQNADALAKAKAALAALPAP